MKYLSASLALLIALQCGAARAALTYNQDFEAMTANQGAATPNDLSNDGWLVGANVFESDGTTFIYNYFAFAAPNGGPAFSAVATGEGGVDQGANQLSVYNDYNNADHNDNPTRRIEANVFRDVGLLEGSDVGLDYTFSFDAKQGNLAGATTATAFFKVIKTSDSSFQQLAIDSIDTTAIGTDWSGGQLQLTIDPTWVGETLQIGFTNTAQDFEGSGVFYDNISVSAVPEPGSAALLALGGLFTFARRRRS
ncbi:MAG: PEP-CTERM sorting domain-containing protein [Planctomycetota bacterium]